MRRTVKVQTADFPADSQPLAAPQARPRDAAAGGSGRATHSPGRSEAPASAGRRRFLGTLGGAALLSPRNLQPVGGICWPIAAPRLRPELLPPPREVSG